MKAAARNQIFSSKGAFTRLSTELFALQERMDPELAVDAVDHDVYVWDVKFMGGFEPGSGLAEDLETLEAVNGYGYVQLRLHFMADLYPFYPPRVELVRPKLAGIIPGAMTAHPRLHLRNWQPFRPIKSVIEHLRAFLQKFARGPGVRAQRDRTFPRRRLRRQRLAPRDLPRQARRVRNLLRPAADPFQIRRDVRRGDPDGDGIGRHAARLRDGV